ncbi:MAG: phenylalanine--tRNA ligase subunit beta, partial [Acidimicrobiales bacterium]
VEVVAAGPGGEVLGALGEVDADVVAAYGLRGRVAFLSVDLAALAVHPRRSLAATTVSRYPASEFDLAFVVPDEVPAAAVHATLCETGGELLEDVGLFDVYRGERLGARRRSLAFRLRYRAPDRTLTEAELADLRAAQIAAVTDAHGAVLRG